MADLSGLLNPKRVIEKRMAEADSSTPPPQTAAPTSPKFTKPYSPEERAKQAEALKLFLAQRTNTN